MSFQYLMFFLVRITIQIPGYHKISIKVVLSIGGIQMSKQRKEKPNYAPTNPDKKIPDEQKRGKAKSPSRGNSL